MPQIFQVLCCFSCEMFQVHQVKKSNKWQCRVCNEKQSLKKAFKIGSSRDCRSLVQELNLQKSGLVHNKDEASAYEDVIDSTEMNGSRIRISDAFDEASLLDQYEMRNIEPDETCLEEDCVVEDKENSCIEDFARQTCKRSFPDENVNHFPEKHLKADEMVQSNYQDRILEIFNNTKQFELDSENTILEESQIHAKETDEKTASVVDSYPKFKKNRGFQMILNAASKLK